MNKHLLLFIMTVTCNFYAPLANSMQQKQTSKIEHKYKTELSGEEKKELEKLFNKKKEEECINFIIKNNFDPNIDNGYLIESSIFSGFLDLLKYLINSGANINVEYSNRDTPLHNATLTGASYEIKTRKNYPNQQLHEKNANKSLEIIKTLVENGANIYSTNQSGKRPINIVYGNLKKSKIYEYLYNLYPCEEKYTTYYNNIKRANTLDIAILLEDPLYKIKEGEDLIITVEASKCIVDEEAAIISASLIRNLLDIPKNKYPFIDISEIRPYSNLMKHMFSENKFSIFITNDREFVILIPHEKYPEIKEAKDLQKIGLNNKNLYTFITHEYKAPYWHVQKKSEELYDELLKQASLAKKIDSRINIESLVDLFLPKRIVDIRAYLFGHGNDFQILPVSYDMVTGIGTVGLQKTLIAQLSNNEYRKLRDTLDFAGCSFLYVKSCFSGSGVYKAQTLHRKEIKPEIKKYLGLSSKYFIEIATSLPGKTTKEKMQPSDFSIFFTNVNNFLDREKNDVTKIINSDKKLTREDKNYLVKNLTEQQVLTGRLELPTMPEKNYIYFIHPIIIRKKEIKKDQLFVKIFKDDLLKLEQNLPRARFPGDKEMLPLKEVFPDLVPQIKDKLKEILIRRKDELKAFKVSLPYFEKQKNAKQTFISDLREEIKRSEVEIEDIEKYIKQLDQ